MDARDKTRRRIAQAAAQILAEEGIQDYLLAKQKAAARLGFVTTGSLPRNEEIEAALVEYHRLYRAKKQPQHIARLRKLALEAMNLLQDFSPRLVGGVLEGNAGEFSPVTLQLFPDSPEEVIKKLLEIRIPFIEKSVSFPSEVDRGPNYPALCFVTDGVEIQLVLLPTALKQHRTSRKERNLPTGDTKSLEALIRQGDLPSLPDFS